MAFEIKIKTSKLKNGDKITVFVFLGPQPSASPPPFYRCSFKD